ncbi:hypothetical protein ACFV0W_00500, partial [Streptomyces anulatus]
MTRVDTLGNGPAARGRTVLISGASIAGPALAYWLNRYGFVVTVVEKAGTVREGGYPIDVRGTALDVVRPGGLEARQGGARNARGRQSRRARAGAPRGAGA